MAQIFKLFCFATSVLLFLQVAGAVGSEKSPSKGDTESNGQGGDEQTPTFLKNVKKLKESKPVMIVKELKNIAGEHVNTFSDNFESTLKAESEKQVNDENSFIPNAVKNNVLLPAKAFAQTSIDTLREPVGQILSSVQKTYADELTKSEQDNNYVPIIGAYTQRANKPVAILKASKNIVGNSFGSIFGKASSFWRLGKRDKAITPADNETSDK